MYEKKLKRGKDGLFVRYIGMNAKGVPEKFRLGYDLQAAEERVKLIAALWREREDRCLKNHKPFWDERTLEAAKSIAKGLPPSLPSGQFEDPIKYVRRVSEISKATGTHFQPMDPERHAAGLRDLQIQMEGARTTVSTALQVNKATGVTLNQAMDAYAASLYQEYELPNGHLRPWGRTRLDQLDSIRSYVGDSRFGRNFLVLDLGELTFGVCDGLYGVFRKRPLTLRSKLTTRMARSSAKNLIKELGKFFDWLDGAEQFDWTPPRRFHAIDKTPDELTPDELYDRRLAREKLVIPDEQLKPLFEYALPKERIFLLLGLNCAFAASEIGQLRIGFLKLDQGLIEGIRFKSGNETRHWLWKQTREGLEWVLNQRNAFKSKLSEARDVVFLTDHGKPIWHATEKGNVSDGVSNIWGRLIKRIRKDQPDFPSYSFNKLRKTSATRILEITNAETASMILAHKTISDDDLLHNYALLPWSKLYEAQKTLEERLASVLEAGGLDPWKAKPKTYIGLAKTKKVSKLRNAGMSTKSIAEQLGISLPSVYRLLQVNTARETDTNRPLLAAIGAHDEDRAQ